MAYQTYITEAVVCGSNESRSADRSFLLFTRDAGMIYAHARSIREERSKQRYALQEFSHVRVTLIRGRTGWKIRGVEPIQSLYSMAFSREARSFLRNIILFLRRTIHGEIIHEGIFDDVIGACRNFTPHSYQKVETILLLRILHALGYIAPIPEYQSFFHCSFPYDRLSLVSEAEIKVYREAIEYALHESQL